VFDEHLVESKKNMCENNGSSGNHSNGVFSLSIDPGF
jgi:hypothetical protein